MVWSAAVCAAAAAAAAAAASEQRARARDGRRRASGSVTAVLVPPTFGYLGRTALLACSHINAPQLLRFDRLDKAADQ